MKDLFNFCRTKIRRIFNSIHPDNLAAAMVIDTIDTKKAWKKRHSMILFSFAKIKKKKATYIKQPKLYESLNGDIRSIA